MKGESKHSKLSKLHYEQNLLGFLFGHLNGNGFAFLYFPEDSVEPFFLLDKVRQRRYFEDASIMIEDLEDERVKVWYFKRFAFDKVNRTLSKQYEIQE